MNHCNRAPLLADQAHLFYQGSWEKKQVSSCGASCKHVPIRAWRWRAPRIYRKPPLSIPWQSTPIRAGDRHPGKYPLAPRGPGGSEFPGAPQLGLPSGLAAPAPWRPGDPQSPLRGAGRSPSGGSSLAAPAHRSSRAHTLPAARRPWPGEVDQPDGWL